MKVIIQLVLLIITLFSAWAEFKNKAKLKYKFTLIMIILNIVTPHFLSSLYPLEEPATKEDTNQIKENLNLIKEMIRNISVPTQQMVETEIDKQFKEKFGIRKKAALTEFKIGVDLYNNHFYQRAIEHFEKAINLFDIPAFYFYRGICHAQLSLFEQSIEDYDKAITLNPNDAKAYNNRGLIWQIKGNYEKALKDYNKAITLNPNSNPGEDNDNPPYPNRDQPSHASGFKGVWQRPIENPPYPNPGEDNDNPPSRE